MVTAEKGSQVLVDTALEGPVPEEIQSSNEIWKHPSNARIYTAIIPKGAWRNREHSSRKGSKWGGEMKKADSQATVMVVEG